MHLLRQTLPEGAQEDPRFRSSESGADLRYLPTRGITGPSQLTDLHTPPKSCEGYYSRVKRTKVSWRRPGSVCLPRWTLYVG